jgi:recombinational DNA repair ATPase RecF
MRLKSFYVRVFRNIIDSGVIKVADSTCIVGKNEAGKSSTIEALNRLNPAKPRPLNLLDDYPRWLKKSMRRLARLMMLFQYRQILS